MLSSILTPTLTLNLIKPKNNHFESLILSNSLLEGALLHGPCLVVFLEEVPQKFKYERSLSNLAKQLAKRGVLEHISFFVATEITGMSEQLRNLIRFKSPPTELQAVIVDLSRDSGPAVFHHTASCVPEIKHPLSEFIEEYINAFANNDLEFQKLLPLG